MSEENIALRLKFLIDNLGLTSSQFADKCNIARPTLSQLLSGRNKKISNLIIEQIHSSFPNLSVLWLLFGEGEMWLAKSDEDSSINSSNQSNDTSNSMDNLKCFDSKDNTNISREYHNNRIEEQSHKNNVAENREYSSGSNESSEYSKETGVNSILNECGKPTNQNVKANPCNTEISSQIEKNKEKSKKVVQITVYFDDSTFQTFYPNK